MNRLITYIIGTFILLAAGNVKAQYAETTADSMKLKRIVQFSGLVVGGDSLYGIPGVTLYVPISGRGTITNHVGYFSLPVLKGDSVVIKSLGFREKNLVIPDAPEGKLSVIIELQEDTTMLPTIMILPWPTERIFKDALLSLKLPHEEIDYMNKNLNEQVMRRMLYTTAPDAAFNHKYYMQQQIQRQENRASYDKTLPFINPFAWARFIDQIKKGEYKNKAKDYQYEEDEDE